MTSETIVPDTAAPTDVTKHFGLSGPERRALAQIQQAWNGTWQEIVASRGFNPEHVTFAFDLEVGAISITVKPAPKEGE